MTHTIGDIARRVQASSTADAAADRRAARFGTFDLDLATGELTRSGRRVALQEQPAQALCLLVTRAGELVTRADLRRTLWADDTHVEFETALNIVITKVRHALGDSAGSPRFVETHPKRGYRFIADVHVADRIGATAPSADGPGTGAVSRRPGPGGGRSRYAAHAVITGAVGLMVFMAAGWHPRFQPLAGRSVPRSIAVLPFKPVVASEADPRLQLGVTEALINRLSRIPGLRVEPFPKVRRYEALDQDPLEAGRALGADAVLEGHFQQADGRVRVRTRLLRTSDGTALAANEWREPFSDLIDVQTAIAQSVADALLVTLSPTERARMGAIDTRNAEAFRHYLFGRHHLEIRELAHLRAAEGEFREALRLDPGYAPAHAALALTLSHMPWQGGPSGLEVMRPAKDAALKALALDDGNALAHSALARIHEWFEHDPVGAQAAHLRAMARGPQEPWVLRSYGHFLLNRDAFDEALELNARELALDPASLLSNRYRAQMLFVARRYDECEAQSHRTVRLDPRDLVLSHSWLARCLEQQGKRDQAVEAWEHGRDVRGGAEIATRLRVQYPIRRLDRGPGASASVSRSRRRRTPLRSCWRVWDVWRKPCRVWSGCTTCVIRS